MLVELEATINDDVLVLEPLEDVEDVDEELLVEVDELLLEVVVEEVVVPPTNWTPSGTLGSEQVPPEYDGPVVTFTLSVTLSPLFTTAPDCDGAVKVTSVDCSQLDPLAVTGVVCDPAARL